MHKGEMSPFEARSNVDGTLKANNKCFPFTRLKTCEASTGEGNNRTTLPQRVSVSVHVTVNRLWCKFLRKPLEMNPSLL